MEKFKISDIQDLFARDVDRFYNQVREDMTRLLEQTPPPADALEDALLQAHTLKGLAATVHAWGLACWGADLERLLEVAGSFLAADRDKANAIFRFVLDRMEDWYVMNQYSLLDLLPEAWGHYLNMRALTEERWRNYLPEIEPQALAVSSFEPAVPAPPQPLELVPPPLRRRDEPPARAVGSAKGTLYEAASHTSSEPMPAAELKQPKKPADAPADLARPKPLELVPPSLRKKTNAAAAARAAAPAPAEISARTAPPVPTAPVTAKPPASPVAKSALSTPPILKVAPPKLKSRAKKRPATPVEPEQSYPATIPVPETVPAQETVAPPVAEEKVPAAPEFRPDADADLLEMLGKEISGYLEELTSQLTRLAGDLSEQSNWEVTRRLFHTIKGTAATFNLEAVSVPAKAAEARCIVAIEDEKARTSDAFEICLQRAQAVGAALRLPFDAAALRAALERAEQRRMVVTETTPAQPALDAEMAGFFIRDATDQIESIEQSVLRWEQGVVPEEQIWAAQRGFHTIKGAANSIGLTALAQSVHDVEAFLEGVAAAGGTGSPPLFAFLLGAVDQLRNYLRRLAGDASAPWQNDWNSALQSLSQPAGAKAAEPAAALVPQAAVAAEGADDEAHTLRIAADRLYRLINLIGEMVIDRSRLEKKIEQLSLLHRALTERNEALTSSVQSFQHQFEFNLLSDRNQAPSLPGRGIRPVPPGEEAAGGPARGEFSDLEFDRYDQFNLLARSLVEISHDIEQLNGEMAGCLDSFAVDNTRFSQTSQVLQHQVTNLSLVPVNSLFPRLKRVFRDALSVEQRDAELVLEGGDAMLDKVVIDKIYAPLMHLLRNSVSHGIEDTATREKLKKPARGQVRFATTQISNQIVIQITDDGAGLQADRIRARAIEKGWLPSGAAPLTPEQVVHFIFQPGFSTASKVTSISGRGIGLDVVRKEIESLNGSVELKYEPGQGSTWTLRLPLTLSISEAILAESGGTTFAFPINFVEAGIILDMPTDFLGNGREMFRIGESSLPVIRLSELLQLPAPAGAIRYAETNGVIVSVGDRRVIVTVSRVLARREIVVKQLDSVMAKHPLLNGATLDAEGEIIPILNLPSLVKFSDRVPGELLRRQSKVDAVEKSGRLNVLIVDDSLSVRKVQERFLVDLGCRAVAATDGLHALEKLREQSFDIVFTDLEMPRLNGYELISEIKSNPAWSGMPVVVISSRGADKYITKAMNLGAATFLNKPFNQHQLEVLLKHHAGWDAKTRMRIAAAVAA